MLLLESTQVINFDEKVEELFFVTINQAHLRSILLICHISLVLSLFLFLFFLFFLQEIVFFSKFLFEGKWNQRERERETHTHTQTSMGVRSCSDDEKFTPLEAAVKQASDDEVVFFVTQLGKCAVGSPYQLVSPFHLTTKTTNLNLPISLQIL